MDLQSPETQQETIIPKQEGTPLIEIKEVDVWENSIARKKIQAQAEANKEAGNEYGTVMVGSDVDGTMLVPKSWLKGTPEEIATEQSKLIKDANSVASWLGKENIPFGYVSGRDHSMIAASEKDCQLPEGDYHIGAVGTEITVRTIDGAWVRDSGYEEYLRTEKHFNRSEVWSTGEMATQQFADLNMRFQSRDSRENIGAWNQEPDKAKELGLTKEDPPQDFKVSFNFNGQLTDVDRVRTYMQEQLAAKGMPNLEIVISSNHTIEGVTDFNVDVLPISKEGAFAYVQSKLGADFSIFAGDSGNDPIGTTGNAGIAVGGRKAELDKVLEGETNISRRTTQHFIAQGAQPKEANRIIFADTKGVRKGPSSVFKSLRALSLLRKLSYTVGRKPVAPAPAVV